MRTHWRGSGIEPGCTGLRLGGSSSSVKAATDASARIHSSSYCRAMGERNSLMDMRARLLGGGFDAARTSAALRTRRPGDMSIRRAIDSRVSHSALRTPRPRRERILPAPGRERHRSGFAVGGSTLSACANSCCAHSQRPI